MPERRTGHDLLVRIRQNPGLVTAEQLSAAFDIDLWKATPGGEERFDAARFLEWVELFMDTDPAVAAERLAQMDAGLVVAGLSPSIAVFDPAAFSREQDIHADIGGYIVVARRPDNWAVVFDALHAFAEHQPIAFHRVMRRCRKLSDSGRELDGCDELMTDAEQARFDLAVSREQRRERQGFLSPQQAHAFLDGARTISFANEAPGTDPVFAAYRRSTSAHEEADADPPAAVVVEELRGAGPFTDAPRALLGPAPGDRPIENAAFNSYLQGCAARDDVAWISTSQDLAFLANAMVAGCFVQDRPLTIEEASDAVAASCNLGLEYWPEIWGDAAHHDLVAIFRVGWTVLHREVSIAASRELLAAAETITSSDRDLQLGLYLLARELRKHLAKRMPWGARGAFDVLASLDLPTWAAMLALVAECPVMLANVSPSRGAKAYRVDPSRFRFVASRADVAAVRDFLRMLPERLTQ